MSGSVHPVHGFPQNYAWGRPAADSEVAKLLIANKCPVNPELRYAELWWGTHPSGPAQTERGTLSALIAENPKHHLGEYILHKWGAELPFLLKVLSVAQALSIQAHPDAERAKVLHNTKPNIYKDPNHKPELALALSPFEALCEFRPANEIATFLTSVPEFHAVVGKHGEEFLAHKNAAALRSLFHALMTADSALVAAQLTKLIARLHGATDTLSQLVVRLHAQYPGDVGVFCPYVLNYLVLQPGEALFLAPNEPHAYLSGECVECMATSDNVVRAGLTPKFKDVETLCEMLTYSMGMPHVQKGEAEPGQLRLYRGSAPEFQVEMAHVDASLDLAPSARARIILVLQGEGTLADGPHTHQLHRGNAFFVSASASYIHVSKGKDSVPLCIVVAGTNKASA